MQLEGVGCGEGNGETYSILPFVRFIKFVFFKANADFRSRAGLDTYIERRAEGFTDPANIRKAKAEVREAQKALREFINKVNADEGETVLRRDYGKETSYGAAELTETEKNAIIKQEEEQRKRAAEIRRIREEVIPLMPTDKLAPRQDIHRVGTNMYEERKASLKAIKQHGPPYLTISDNEVLELVNRYKGTGEIKLSKRSGKWDNEETILTNDTVVGIAVNNLNGKTAGTTVFRIHYSKNGVHIVPDYPSKKRKVKRNDNEGY